MHRVYIFLFSLLRLLYCALRAHVRCKRLINTLLHYITYVICVFPWRIPTYPKVDVGSLMCARTQSVRAGHTGKGETLGH